MIDNKITFIYCYRDRDLVRVKLSLDSLKNQINKNFKVLFIDYGSKLEIANDVSTLVNSYDFAEYHYNDTRGKVWNRSHALNTAIRLVETEFVFTSDIDMIYKPGFIDHLYENLGNNKANFYTAVMLPDGMVPDTTKDYPEIPRTLDNAMGWAIIPVAALKEINGYDEFYCIYGKEDNDIADRLRLKGLNVKYIQDIWMYHYYHPHVPRQKGIMPSMWFLFLDEYYKEMKSVIVRNNKIEWGSTISLKERQVSNLTDALNTSLNLKNISAKYFAYAIENALTELNSGDISAITVNQEYLNTLFNSKPFKISSSLNRIFLKFNIPLAIHSKFANNFTDVEQVRDEFLYFTINNRYKIRDYYYIVEGNSFMCSIQKR